MALLRPRVRRQVGCDLEVTDIPAGPDVGFVDPGVSSLFPFERVREGQRAFLADAVAAVREGRHLLAHAPTGIGKTAVALTAAVSVARRRGLIVLFLTSKQSQHWIAVETLRRMRARGHGVIAVDVVAKRSMCLHERAPEGGIAFREFCEHHVRDRTCPWFARPADAAVKLASQKVLHVRELVEAARACGTCPHKAAIEAARRAHAVVCDYNYVFSDIRDRILPRIERPLSEIVLVVDEAHNLPDRIRSHLSGDLDSPALVRASKEAKPVDPEASAALLAAARGVHQALAKLEGEREVGREALVGAVEAGLRGWDLGDLVRATEAAGANLAERGLPTVLPDVALFLRRWRDVREGILRIAVGGAGGRFSMRLLDPSVLSRAVFREVHASLLMSGTLHPPEMYADLLGIETERRVLRSYSNPFPPENRPVLVSPSVSTSYDRRGEAMYRRIAEEVARVAGAARGNAAAFFPSYEVLAEVRRRLPLATLQKPVLVERREWGARERGRAVEALRNLQGGVGGLLMAVLGGSLSEGVDYAGNLLRIVAVVGLPLAPPSLEADALRRYYVGKFGPERGHDYAVVYPAVIKVLQAAGRCIRSERDRAAVVVMEDRVLQVRYARCFPADFPLVAVADAANEVRTFFYGARASARPCS